MSVQHQIRDHLRAAAAQRELTDLQIAIRSGLHRRTLRRFWAGEHFSFETAERIALVLRVEFRVERTNQRSQ